MIAENNEKLYLGKAKGNTGEGKEVKSRRKRSGGGGGGGGSTQAAVHAAVAFGGNRRVSKLLAI